jgi:hypothetical protein
MRVTNENLLAGRPLPDKEVTELANPDLTQVQARMRQRSLFEFSNQPGRRQQQQQGRAKTRSNFVPNQFASIPWGDPVVSGEEIESTDTFQTEDARRDYLNDHARWHFVEWERAINTASLFLDCLSKCTA